MIRLRKNCFRGSRVAEPMARLGTMISALKKIVVRTPNKKSSLPFSNLFSWTAVALVAGTLLSGCLIPSQQATRGPDVGPEPLQVGPSQAGSQKLIKPYIPGEEPARSVQESSRTGPEPPRASQEPPRMSQEPPRPAVEPPSAQTTPPARPPVPATGGTRTQWEDQKVKNAALEVAKEIPSAKKIKICYIAAQDEWLVIVYDDIGTAIDVKQYFWDREREILKPFLLLKHIAHDRLEREAREKEPGKACEVLDPPAR